MTVLFTIVFTTVFAGPIPATIPRTEPLFSKDPGFWEGGKPCKAILSDIRFQFTPKRDRERWSIVFEGPSVPSFRLRYIPEDSPRFILSLFGLEKNAVTVGKIERLVQTSRLVSQIVIYPQIEGGDLIVELALTEPLSYKVVHPHQNARELILDLRDVKTFLN